MRHTLSPMEAARRQWWSGLAKLGDPMRIVDPLSAGFRAGWEASGAINVELVDALRQVDFLAEDREDIDENGLPNFAMQIRLIIASAIAKSSPRQVLMKENLT
jgi:hypothetical protein